MRPSVRLLLTILLGGIVGLVTLALSLAFAVHVEHEAGAEASLETISSARSAATILETQLEQQLQALAMLATGATLVADLEAGRADRLTVHLERAAPANPDLGRMAIIDARGVLVANSATDKSAVGRSFAEQPHVRAALNAARASIGTPRLAIGQHAGIPVLPIGVPVTGASGRVIGVLQATTELSRLNTDLASVRVGRGGFVSVEAADGSLIAHPDAERLLSPAADAMIDLAALEDPLTRAQQLLALGQPLWLSSTVTMPSTGWTVRAQLPAAEIVASLRRPLVMAALVAGLTALLAVGLGILIASHLTTPLEQLTRVADTIETNDPIEALPRSGPREVLQLATAFGDMAERLAERTAQHAVAEARLLRQATRLTVLSHLNQVVVASLDLDEVFREVAHAAATLFATPVASLWVVDEAARSLELRAFSDEEIGRSRSYRTATFGQGVAGWVAEHHEWQFVDDVFSDGRTRELSWWREHGLRSMLTVPLIDNERVVAVLSIHGSEPIRLDADDHDHFAIFLAQATIAVRNASLYAAEASSRAAAELAEAQFRAVVDSTPDPVLVWDDQGWIQLANHRVERLVGYTADELLGRHGAMLISENQAPTMAVLIGRACAQPGATVSSAGTDLLFRRKDGSEVPIEMSLTTIATPAGIRRIATVRDISERRALEQTKERFVSMVSHELRTPLTPIIGMAQLLSSSGLSDVQARMADTISRSGQNLLTIVNDLLDFSKIEADQLALESIDLDVRDLVESVIALLGTKAVDKDLNLTWHVDRAVPGLVTGDPVRLRQIVNNLVDNALKFTQTGEVMVRAHLAEETPATVLLRFEVADTGIGVSTDSAERLFEPFVQAASSTTRQYGGTGLGLTICKRLAELMGGRIGIESEPGIGTTIWFTARFERLTAERAAADRRPVPAALRDLPGADPATAPILVVEDSPMNQLTIIGLLEQLGYRARAVDNGRQAIEALDGGTFAAVLMDCQMPIMDGYEATAWIRRGGGDSAHLPIIAMTASAMPEDRARCLAVGMDDYISKPLQVEELTGTLARWTRQAPDHATSADRPRRLDGHPTASILDLERLHRLSQLQRSNGAWIVDDVIRLYSDSAPGLAGLIREAIARGDPAGLAEAAHRLRGESGSVGASAVESLARELEAIGHAGHAPACAEIERLDRTIADATAALRQFRRTSAGGS